MSSSASIRIPAVAAGNESPVRWLTAVSEVTGRSLRRSWPRSADPAARPPPWMRARSSANSATRRCAVVTARSAIIRTPSRRKSSHPSQSPLRTDQVEEAVVLLPVLLEVKAQIERADLLAHAFRHRVPARDAPSHTLFHHYSAMLDSKIAYPGLAPYRLITPARLAGASRTVMPPRTAVGPALEEGALDRLLA